MALQLVFSIRILSWTMSTVKIITRLLCKLLSGCPIYVIKVWNYMLESVMRDFLCSRYKNNLAQEFFSNCCCVCTNSNMYMSSFKIVSSFICLFLKVVVTKNDNCEVCNCTIHKILCYIIHSDVFQLKCLKCVPKYYNHLPTGKCSVPRVP